MSSVSGMAASCTLNVTFYACDFGERFLGCCDDGSPADTCINGCPQQNLLPATFDAEYYDYVTRAACTSGDWWSCANTSPPFLGCCLSNPCLDGCPPSDLTAAIFSQNQTDNPLYSAISAAPTTPSSTTSSSASTAASSTLLQFTGAADSATTSPVSLPQNLTREIVGPVVGGIVAVGGILIGMLLLYRRLKSRRYKGSDPAGVNDKGSIKDTINPSPEISKAFRQENEASHESSTPTANTQEKSRVPIKRPRSLILAPYIEKGTPLEIESARGSAAQENHEEDKTPQELPPNHAPLPEIATSDPPQSRHELPSSDPAVREHVHPRALQPGRPEFTPYSADNLSQFPQPYGLAFRPHSPSRLSVVSSLGSSPPVGRGVSSVSVTNGEISADV